MGRHRSIISAAVAVTITSGCGGQGTLAAAPAEDSTATATAEQGAEVDLDLGSSGEMVVDGGDLPDGFPEDLPLPAGLVVNSALASGPGAFEVHGVIETGSVEAVLDELGADLAAEGWSPELLEVDGSPVGLRALDGEGRYEVQITDLGEPPLLVLLQVRLP